MSVRFPNLMSVRQEAFEKLAHGFSISGEGQTFCGPTDDGQNRTETPQNLAQSLHEVVLGDFRSFSEFILNGEVPEDLAHRFELLLAATEEERA
jgi:hypothetical protein